MDLTWLPDPSSLGMATMPNPCAMSLAFSSAMGVAYPSTLGLARLPDSWLLSQIWLSNLKHLVFVRLSDPIILGLTRLPDSSSLSLTWLYLMDVVHLTRNKVNHIISLNLFQIMSLL